jgi:uncharacterized protein (DUF433 family)
MQAAHKTYVERRDGGYWIAGTRISLDSVVYAYQRGAAPESIQKSYPLLILEEVYGAIAFYLGNQQQIDAYLDASEAEFAREAEKIKARFRADNPNLIKRLEKVRHARSMASQ